MDQHVEAVKHYIREHARAGVSTDIAVQQLRTAGWQEPYIQQALHELHAESAPAAPKPSGLPVSYQTASAAQPVGTPSKATLNPFTHLSRGTTRLLQSNLAAAIWSTIGVIVINVALAVVMLVVAFISIMSLDSAGEAGSTFTFPWIIITITAAIIVIYMLLNGYMMLVLNRLVLLSGRKEKAKFGQLIRFSFKRYPKLILTYLLVSAVVIAAFGIAIATLALPKPYGVIISILLNLTAMVFVIIYGLRISFINLVIADTPAPGSPLHIIRRSTAVWRRSVGAVILYSLAVGGIYALLSMSSGALGFTLRSVPISAPSSLPWLGAVPEFLIPSLLITIMQIGAAAGFADIYNEVSSTE